MTFVHRFANSSQFGNRLAVRQQRNRSALRIDVGVAVIDAQVAVNRRDDIVGLQRAVLRAFATAPEFGLSADDNGLLVMPLCHANSLYFGVTFAMLGATIVVDDRKSFDPEALLAKLASEKITFTSLVPTHYIMMLSLPDAVKARRDVRAVGKLLISSAPARKDTKLAILELFPNGKLFELYGSTEAAISTMRRKGDPRGSVGQILDPAVKILDDRGNECEPAVLREDGGIANYDAAVGEICRSAPETGLFQGYFDNPDANSSKYREGVYHSGDLGPPCWAPAPLTSLKFPDRYSVLTPLTSVRDSQTTSP